MVFIQGVKKNDIKLYVLLHTYIHVQVYPDVYIVHICTIIFGRLTTYINIGVIMGFTYQ